MKDWMERIRQYEMSPLCDRYIMLMLYCLFILNSFIPTFYILNLLCFHYFWVYQLRHLYLWRNICSTFFFYRLLQPCVFLICLCVLILLQLFLARVIAIVALLFLEAILSTSHETKHKSSTICY